MSPVFDSYENMVDVKALEGKLQSMMPGKRFELQELLDEIMSGHFDGIGHSLKRYVLDILYGEKEQLLKFCVLLFVMGMIAAIAYNLCDFFEKKDWERTMYIPMILMIGVVLFGYFNQRFVDTRNYLTELLEFMRLYLPVYGIALGMSKGSLYAIAHLEWQMLLLYVTEGVIAVFLVPLLKYMAVFQLVQETASEPYFRNITRTMKKILLFFTRLGLFFAISGSVLQGLVLPKVDVTRGRFLVRICNIIPGVSSYSKTVSDLILQSLTVFQSALGITGAILLLVICLKPVIVTFLYGASLHVASALLQTTGEKVISKCFLGISDLFLLLSRLQLFSLAILFVGFLLSVLSF